MFSVIKHYEALYRFAFVTPLLRGHIHLSVSLHFMILGIGQVVHTRCNLVPIKEQCCPVAENVIKRLMLHSHVSQTYLYATYGIYSLSEGCGGICHDLPFLLVISTGQVCKKS